MSGEIISFGKAVAASLNVTEQLESVEADVAELRRLGVQLECTAATLTAVAQRVEAKQADYSDFAIAEAEYEFTRDSFREQLGAVTGRSAAWIERLLAL
jgi:hypothetical protein